MEEGSEESLPTRAHAVWRVQESVVRESAQELRDGGETHGATRQKTWTTRTHRRFLLTFLCEVHSPWLWYSIFMRF